MQFRKRSSDFSSGRTPDKNKFFIITLTEIARNIVVEYIYIVNIGMNTNRYII